MKKKFLILMSVIVFGVGVVVVTTEAQRLNYNQGYEPEQPVKYNHKLHAGDYQIPCLYCHFAAEKGRHAGIPPVELCMNCHKRVLPDRPEIAKLKDALSTGKTIEWIKVHHFPDFAYFNHSQHVSVGKVTCQECHGPVETMVKVRQENMLNMGWCLDCHRSKGIAAPTDHKNAGASDCARCHY
ncbi:MAG: cytochrome c3 family protein [Bdellovibrionota bacterium]